MARRTVDGKDQGTGGEEGEIVGIEINEKVI